MRDDYWTKFWKEYGRESAEADPHVRVLRTQNKVPISDEAWERTLRYIEGVLRVDSRDNLLELACGNGLVARRLSRLYNSVVAVDISENLLSEIDADAYPNIERIAQDMRACAFDEESFDAVVLYAGLQYLAKHEAVDLWKRVYAWLRPGGLFFLGDIPDERKLWSFYNSQERESVFFENLKSGRDPVGYWYDQELLVKLSRHVGFEEARIIPQAPYMLYSHYRFDMVVQKAE